MAITIRWEDVNLADKLPQTKFWRLPELRDFSQTEAEIYWRIHFNGYKIATKRGQVGGKPVVTFREIETNNSGRSLNEQAWLEAKRRYIIKRRKGYQSPYETEDRTIKFMRGVEYEPSKHHLFLPVDVDTKLDGMRMGVFVDYPSPAEDFTRGQGHFPHVGEIVDEVYELSQYLPPACIVDGEMWKKGYHLNEISSILRSEKKRDPRMDEIQFHIFDLSWDSHPCQEVRRKTLEDALALYRLTKFGYTGPVEYGTGGVHKELEGKTKLFLSKIEIAETIEKIYKIQRHYVDDLGYEGAMIRRRANGKPESSKEYNLSRYNFGKSTRILKVIDFFNEEGKCIDVRDSKGTSEGCARLILKDKRGNIVRMAGDGTIESRREWMRNPSMVVGKYITFQYKQLSVHGVPLNMVAKGIRNENEWTPDEEIVITDEDIEKARKLE